MSDELAFQSWCDWAGLDQAERDSVGGRIQKSQYASVVTALSQIHSFLYREPWSTNHADRRFEFASEAKFPGGCTETTVDLLYSGIADELDVRPRAFWPERSPYAVCLTHDIDRVCATYQRARGFFASPWAACTRLWRDLSTSVFPSMRSQNVYYNFDQALRMHQEAGTSATFFVLFERRRWLRSIFKLEPQHVFGLYRPESVAQELQRLQSAGHEVALHGSFESWNNSQELRDELHRLRSLGLDPGLGCRNHYLWFDPVATPRAQTQAGMIYDSSIGFNFGVGFRARTAFPYRVGNVLELPMHLMDTALRACAPDAVQRADHARQVLNQVRKVGGLLVMNWHLHHMNPEAFPAEWDLWMALVREARGDGAWIAPAQRIAQWWNQRAWNR